MSGEYLFTLPKVIKIHVDINNHVCFLAYSWFAISLLGCKFKDNVSHPRRLDSTMELITYSFVLYTSNMAAMTLYANHL